MSKTILSIIMCVSAWAPVEPSTALPAASRPEMELSAEQERAYIDAVTRMYVQLNRVCRYTYSKEVFK